MLLLIDKYKTDKFDKYNCTYFPVSYNMSSNVIIPLKNVVKNLRTINFHQMHGEFGVEALNHCIIKNAKNFKPDYIIWTSSMYEIFPSTFKKLKKMGIPVIGWFYDDHTRFDNWGKFWLPYLSYAVTNDSQSIEKYKRLGVSPLLSFCGAQQEEYKKIELPKLYDVSFVGANISDRREYISFLEQNGIKVKVVGKGWANSGFVDFDDMINIYNQSKINLNFTGAIGNSQIKQLKGRIFEIAVTGNFLLTEYAPSLEVCYEQEKSIVWFKTKEELLEKIKFYLDNEDKRILIEKNMQKKTLEEHTNEARLKKLFYELENKKPIKKVKLNNKEIKKFKKSLFHYNWLCLKERFKIKEYKIFLSDLFYILNPLNY